MIEFVPKLILVVPVIVKFFNAVAPTTPKNAVLPFTVKLCTPLVVAFNAALKPIVPLVLFTVVFVANVVTPKYVCAPVVVIIFCKLAVPVTDNVPSGFVTPIIPPFCTNKLPEIVTFVAVGEAFTG